MKKILLGSLLLLLAAAGYGIYLFNLKPSDTRYESAAFKISAAELVKEFSKDEVAATLKFVDQVIVVSGTVGEIQLERNEGSVILISGDPVLGVTCSFYSDETSGLKKLSKGMTVHIKGKCTGKLMDVVLNNCSLIL